SGGDEHLGEAEPCGDEHLGKTEPSEKLWTVRRDGAVKLRTRHVSEQRPPLTVPQFFSQSVRRWDQRRALCVKRADKWTKITYAEYECQTRSVARSLLKLGLQRFHGVLILGCTSPEWFMAEIGSILAGGLAVGVDPSCSASFCQEVAIRSKAQVVIVQDPGQLEKILQVIGKLQTSCDQPNGMCIMLKFLCFFFVFFLVSSIQWDAFLALGTDLDDVCLNEVMESQKANQCWVMLSHDNITWMAHAVCDHLNLGPNEVVVSYQPLNDLTVQLMDLWLPLCCGGTTYFAESNGPEVSALWSLLISVLRHSRPTIFLGCRTFWEKVKSVADGLAVWPLMVTASSYRDYMDRFYQLPLNFLSKLLVSNPARAALGLNHCAFCYSGTSVAPSETMEFFWKLGLKMLRLYGFNETCGVHGIGHPNDDPIPSCEQTVSGCLSRRAFSTKCLWGRHIFMGYLDMEEETQSVLDKDGWLCIRVEAIDADGSGRAMADASPRGSCWAGGHSEGVPLGSMLGRGGHFVAIFH
uniref:long-chain-fatty-acid--CoA ligase n=1 Tax=Leptobrachium leishanense TaxID=445787 RepID=A0A8C5R083_9ANUR